MVEERGKMIKRKKKGRGAGVAIYKLILAFFRIGLQVCLLLP